MSNLHPKSGSNQLILFSHQQKAVRCYRNLIFQGYCVRQECLFWGAWKVIEKGIFRIKSYIEFILNSVLCPECLIGRMNHFIVVDSFHVGEKRIIAIPILGAFFLIEFIVRGRTVYSDVIRVIPACPLAVRFLTVMSSTDPGSCSSRDIRHVSLRVPLYWTV